jgi:hypothetical protein
MHYQRQRIHGSTNYTKQADSESVMAARFWRKVNKSPGCWIWQAGRTGNGYGSFGIAGRSYRAHRIAYEMAYGPIPTAAEIDHRCHSRLCVNPEHLRAVTKKQNQENRAGPWRCSTSGIRGVSWKKDRNRWVAHITHNHKQMHLGYFDTTEEAEAVAVAKRNELFTHNDLDRKAS